MDVAGTVVALGSAVEGLSIRDEVVGELPGGGLARFAAAPAGRLVPRPATVSPEDAAALPIAAGTAWQALDLAGVPAVAQQQLHEIKSSIILQPGPAALTDGVQAIQKVLIGWEQSQSVK